jgi:hypothetical protein
MALARGLVQMRRLDDPFFRVTPIRADGMLERTGGHSIHWLESVRQ